MVCLRQGNFTRHLSAKHNYTHRSASQTSKGIHKKMSRKRVPSLLMSSFFPAAKKKKTRTIPHGSGGVGVDHHLKCPECSYTAKWPSDLRRHRQVHTIVKRFKCSLCNNKYKYAGDLNVHMRRDHMVEPKDIVLGNFVSSDVVRKASPAIFRCPICPFSTHSKADLEQHSKQHKDIQKTFQCRQCGYQTYWRGDVARHLFRHHKILLGKNSQEIDDYFIHRPEIRPLTKQLQQGGISSNTATPSVIVNEKSAVAVDAVVKEELNFVVNLDDMDTKPMESNDFFTPPATSCDNYKRPDLVSKKVKRKKVGRFYCTIATCNYRTTSADRLETHLAKHEDLKRFMCPNCGKRTNWQWDIVKHLINVHGFRNATNDNVIKLSIEQAKSTIWDYVKHKKKSLYPRSEFNSTNKKIGLLLSPGTSQDKFNNSSSSGRNELPPVKINLPLGDMSNDLSDIACDNLFVNPPPEELARYDKPFACALCKKAEVTKEDVKKHYNHAHPYKDVQVIYVGDGTEFDYDTNAICFKMTEQSQQDINHENGSEFFSSKTVRSDSKYSNPKLHGYVKPFKCSICGLRSNWKWDLKKHLRSKHPNQGGFVIMLSIPEAKSTFAVECSPSHPKEDNKQPPTSFELPSLKTVSSNGGNRGKSCSNQFSSYTIDGEPYDANYGIFGSLDKSPGGSRLTRFDPKRRQWKCSGCNYLTNWRRNMARHVRRHHGMNKKNIRIIPVHMLDEDAQQSLLNQLQMKRPDGQRNRQNKVKRLVSSSNAGNNRNNINSLFWQCSKCTFHSSLKTHIIIHMQKHGMKPFSCSLCSMPFMNRGSLHRHLQRVHGRSDYTKLCKVNIDYGNSQGENQPNAVEEQKSVDNVFVCAICQVESKEKAIIASHIVDFHGVKDFDDHIACVQSANNDESESLSLNSCHEPSILPGKKRMRKQHHCNLCPFRTQKKSMLLFHMTYHKPSEVNRFKCKFCPYYVSTTRLLHQHQTKWHSYKKTVDNKIIHTSSISRANVGSWDQTLTTPPSSPVKRGFQQMGTPGGTSQRRHMCDKCPYTTASKNDFIYHKQVSFNFNHNKSQ